MDSGRSDSENEKARVSFPRMGGRTGRARRARPGLSIQSKLLIMLLAVSVGSTLAVGAVGFASGTDSLRQAAYERLTSLREGRALALEALMEQIGDDIVLASKGSSVVDATSRFADDFAQLDTEPLDPARAAAVETYYNDVFIPALEQQSGQKTESALFLPRTPAQTHLQALYTAPFADREEAAALDDAGDGSAWSATHRTYNAYFHDMADRYDYGDLLLLDTEGNVIYSVHKGVDLGTNVRTGPYSNTALADAYDRALSSNTLDAVVFEDLERYQPALDVPTGWAVSAVGDGDRVVGALAVQFPFEAVNRVMTVDEDWAQRGLGETGEAYIVGDDHLMRSTAREVVEDPAGYESDAIAAGTDPRTAARMREYEGTVLLQEVDTPSVAAALRGETGTDVETNYLGREVLSAYAPLPIEGADWVVVASLDTAEAFAPVAAFARHMVLTIAAILLLVAVLSLALAQVFTRPIRTLVAAVRRVAGGELATEVPIRSRDEFGDLAGAFNDMSRTLQIKQDLIDEQRTENDKLLHTLMPDPVARRYREGEDVIAQTHDDVAVVFADLVGFDDFAAGFSPEEELRALNELLHGFDDAAEQHGVEKVRMLREGYLASCGLVVPRVDNVRRIVEFTLAIRKVVARFNSTHDAALELRAGIDCGAVKSGVVGRASVAYDMWGEAVSLANRVQGSGGRPGIFVTDRVRKAMADSVPFAEAGTIDTHTGTESVWEIVQE
jgi:class 3 adenylate cyclase